MRILALNWRDLGHPWAGGAEVCLDELTRRWVAWGHDVTVLAGAWDGCKPEELVGGVRIVRRGSRLTVYPHAALAYLAGLRREVDVILDVENAIPFFTPLYARRPRVLMVHHVHREQVFIEAGFPLDWGAYVSETWLMPAAYRRCAVVTGSASTRADLGALGFDLDRVTVVSYGLDHARFCPAGARAPEPTVLYLGRLKRYKRIDLAVRAMPQVLRACPGARLVIAGQGDTRSPLAGLVAELGLERHVRLLGLVDEAEKVRLLREAWVFTNPSMAEGWGLSVLEANACGAPAVVFDVPGLRDSVVDGETGVVVPEGDVAGYARALARLLSDDAARGRLGDAAIGWARRFDWDTSAKALLEVLSGACRRGGWSG